MITWQSIVCIPAMKERKKNNYYENIQRITRMFVWWIKRLHLYEEILQFSRCNGSASTAQHSCDWESEKVMKLEEHILGLSERQRWQRWHRWRNIMKIQSCSTEHKWAWGYYWQQFAYTRIRNHQRGDYLCAKRTVKWCQNIQKPCSH